MNKLELKKAIEACHAKGQKVALSFCAHVPNEILEAAGFCSMRIFHINDIVDTSERALPRNVCPAVKEVYCLLEDEAIKEADLIITESSCDGKKKMYELITAQDKVYYYQVPQGNERDYVHPLLRSEANYMIKTLDKRFGAKVTADGLREAGKVSNAEREAVMALMDLQKSVPPVTTGLEIYKAWEDAQLIPDRAERTAQLLAARDRLAQSGAKAPQDAKRILVTGCPIGGVYEKVLTSVEAADGVVVCFENCEFAKVNLRHLDTEAEDMIEALVDCYQNTPCAIMGDNGRRFALLKKLAEEYKVDGILDIALTTCHAYTVEREKMHRFCGELGIPYLFLESDYADTDAGQMKTRIAAFVELL